MKRVLLLSILLIIAAFVTPVSSSLPPKFPAVKWLTLSYDEYEAERDAVRAFYKTEIDMIENENSFTSIDIAIGFHDFNDDGVEEIISFISGNSSFHGTRASGYLNVFAYDGKRITGNRGIAGFPLDNSTLNDPSSKQIGVIPNKSGWDYLYVNTPDIDVRIWETEIDNNGHRCHIAPFYPRNTKSGGTLTIERAAALNVDTAY